MRPYFTGSVELMADGWTGVQADDSEVGCLVAMGGLTMRRRM